MHSVKLFTIREPLLYNQQRNRCFPTETSRRTEAARLAQIADRLDVSIDWLLGRTDDPEINDQEPPPKKAAGSSP